MKIIASYVAVSVAAMASAFAGTNPTVSWSLPGAACIVDTRNSTAQSSVGAQTGDVVFAGTSTGTIRLVCPIAGLFPNDTTGTPNVMSLVIYDQDGTTDHCYVKATLWRNNVSATEGGGAIASYDGTTDTTLNGYPYRNVEGSLFTHTWNFDSNFYWIDVTLFRDVTTCQAALEGVILSSSF